jgi:hypothetical protein
MNMDYRIVAGAKRGYEAWRDGERSADTAEQRLERLGREMGMKEDDGTTMEQLERKAEDARTEISVADALNLLRESNARREKTVVKLGRDVHEGREEAEGGQDA